ncbi:hypothetical protein D3C79_1079010 [compost metagenome]
MVGLLQQQAGGTVVPGPQALAVEKAGVVGIEQPLRIADQAKELLWADQRFAADHVVVKQPAAA